MNRSPMILPLLLLLVGCEALDPAASPTASSPLPSQETSMPAEASDDNQSAKMNANDSSDEGAANEKVVRTETEWKKRLSDEEYRVLREKGTEQPFTNKYDEHFEPGAYACAACDQVLFESDTKFNSGCGWPAFYASKAGDRVTITDDLSHGMVRKEVTCTRCGSHLGHIFDDAPGTPTGQRYCINSVSLKFLPKKAEDSPKPKPKP